MTLKKKTLQTFWEKENIFVTSISYFNTIFLKNINIYFSFVIFDLIVISLLPAKPKGTLGLHSVCLSVYLSVCLSVSPQYQFPGLFS